MHSLFSEKTGAHEAAAAEAEEDLKRLALLLRRVMAGLEVVRDTQLFITLRHWCSHVQ